jgi:5'-nucleotidase / UDP-sugar diphosphatase
MALTMYLRFLLLLLSVSFAFDSAMAQTARILYYSSNPEIIRSQNKPGLGEVAAIVRKERDQGNNVLFIHGGASLGPSVLGALDNGAHMIDVLNMLEPDLMAIGKREFSYKEDEFTLRALSAAFPFIATNLVQKDSLKPLEGVETSIVLDVDGLSIGFIALTSQNAILQYGAEKIVFLPTDSILRSTAAQMRAAGADAIVLLADTDFSDMSAYTKDHTVDAILYAHSFDNPYSADAGGTTIKEGALDGHLVVLTLQKKMTGKAPTIESKLSTIDLHGQDKDPEVQSLIQSYADRLEILLSQEIGVTERGFNTLRNLVRTKESAFGNLVTDAVRSAMHADIAIINSGGIRGNKFYKSGQMLTREDIQLELPFNNTVELFEVTGEQLRQALEWGIGCIDVVDGCFLQVSNMKVTFDPDLPRSRRISEILIGGKAIDLAKTYRLGTLNFIADGGDGFKMLSNSRRLTQTGSGKLLWEVVVTYLKSLPKIEPKLEGRLLARKSNGPTLQPAPISASN